MIKKGERDSNFELMRIISMIFIVLCHVIGHGNVINNCRNQSLKIVIEIIKFCTYVHVNSFILLSGFFQSKSSFKQSKVWSLINSASFYKIVIILIFSSLGVISLSKGELFFSLFPLNQDEYWFVNYYILLYFFSPFLNILINKITKKQYIGLIFLMFLLFSILPLISFFKSMSNNGFSLYDFTFLYLIGAFLRKYPLENSYILVRFSRNLKQILFIFIFISCVIFNYVFYKFSFTIYGINSVLDTLSSSMQIYSSSYNNIFIIIQSISYFLIFKNISFKNKFINNIASLVMGVYLISDNNYMRIYIYKWLNIDVSNIYSFGFIGYIFLITFLIFCVCLFIEFVRQLIFKFLYKLKISKKVRNKYYNFLKDIKVY